jgi:uncharacterized membrane protein YbhN (UPF0104 family)
VTRRRWRPEILGGYVAAVLLFLALEFRGLRDHHDDWPTATDVIRRYWPRLLTVGVLVVGVPLFLVLHFGLELW